MNARRRDSESGPRRLAAEERGVGAPGVGLALTATVLVALGGVVSSLPERVTCVGQNQLTHLIGAAPHDCGDGPRSRRLPVIPVQTDGAPQRGPRLDERNIDCTVDPSPASTRTLSRPLTLSEGDYSVTIPAGTRFRVEWLSHPLHMRLVPEQPIQVLRNGTPAFTLNAIVGHVVRGAAGGIAIVPRDGGPVPPIPPRAAIRYLLDPLPPTASEAEGNDLVRLARSMTQSLLGSSCGGLSAEARAWVQGLRRAVPHLDDFWRRWVPGYASPEEVSFDGNPTINSRYPSPYTSSGITFALSDVASGYRGGRGVGYLILGHEWGHHVQRLLAVRRTGAARELQADCLAGAWLARAYEDGLVTRDEILEADRALGTTWSGGTHPPAADRQAALRRGLGSDPRGRIVSGDPLARCP
jgi:hypothetical protein